MFDWSGATGWLATAFSHRNSPFNLLIVGIWLDPADTDAHVGWVRKLWQEMQPYSSGVYVNYLGQEEDEGRERIRAAYDPAVYGRLADLKRKYDPNNLFRMNQNIAPASSPSPSRQACTDCRLPLPALQGLASARTE